MVEPQPNDFSRAPRSTANTPQTIKAHLLPVPSDTGYFRVGPTLSDFDFKGYTGGSPCSMPDNAPHRTTPAREWSRPENRRRQSNSNTPARPHGFHPSAASPSAGYSHPPSLVQHSEHIHPASGQPFHSPSIHYTPPAAYPQSTSYYGPYTVPSQPTLSMVHSTPYSYPHGYHSPPAPESILGRRDVQSGFQPIAQAHYPYQQHPQEDASTSSTTPSGPTVSTPRYSSHPSSPTGNPTHSSYMSSGHFSGMAYPSPPMSTPQFGYSQHYSATPPMYRPYGPMGYAQHPASPPEEAPGAWYFVSHGNAPPPPQYHFEGTQYQNPYAAQYAPQSADHAPFAPQPSAPPASHSLAAPLPAVPGTSRSAPPTALPPPSTDAGSGSGSSRPPSAPAESKPVTRREWHPRPPPHRSPWVMWVGNVPSDATQEELSRFFSINREGRSSDAEDSGAVVSIFLIARSNCAFINYANEASLLDAIQKFNGQRLRPNDPQCPMLVCKVRRSADDLKSGVGGQRGTGLHMQWVRDQRKLQNQARSTTDVSAASDDASVSSRSAPDHLAGSMASMSIAGPPRPRGTNQSSSSESYASTSSSFLGEHFPTRYFILKSLSERDLELSVESGLWATQKHNELVLDRAYRTSANVYLIFSVNKSGEFYGFARMTGPIRQGEGNVSWSSRSRTSPPSHASPPTNPISPQESRLLSEGPVYQSPEEFMRVKRTPLTPSILATAQPPELENSRQEFEHYATAPAKLGGADASHVERSPSMKLSLDQHQRRQTQGMGTKPAFKLDPQAPMRAVRGSHSEVDGDEGARQSQLESVQEGWEGSEGPTEAVLAKPSPTWGDCFKVEWRELRKVPFHRTRHLRNAWNKGREIKVSRDGTELESSVGRRLLEEWDEMSTPNPNA